MASPALGAQEPSVEKRVELVVYAKGSPDSAVVEGFLSALAEIDERIPSLAFIGERREDPVARARADAIVACGANIRCIAGVGVAARATHVLFGRVSEQAGRVGMQWLLVEVSSATVTGKFRTSPPDVAAARADAATMVAQVLGVTGPVSAAPASAGDAPRRQECSPAAPASAPPRELGWSSPQAVGTLAAIVSGALFLGVGLYLGEQSHAADGATRARDAGGLVDRLVVTDRPRRGTNRNGAALALGGVLVAGGCALWIRDSIRLSPAIAVGSDGGVAGVSVAW